MWPATIKRYQTKTLHAKTSMMKNDQSQLSAISCTSPSKPWLEGLNPQQIEAVSHLDGALLVLSGAGTGKTRVLTSRLANLIDTGRAKPWNILAVTFTNKAAREMKDRIAAMIGDMVEQVWFGTFHALAARILRRHAECVGLTSNFTILDTDDQLRLIKQVMEAMDLDAKRFPPRMVLAIIDRWKNKGLTADKVSAASAGDMIGGKAQRLYEAYQQRLISLNACDFGDLLLHNLTIFNTYPDILALYHQRITHIMVDEYQDTNVAQYLWLRLLAQHSRNLCCVGDDDQSIYGWRGAEVSNILRFTEIYPEAVTIRLEQNYRSTAHILGAASGLVAHNKNRLGKTLFTASEDGEAVRLVGCWDGGGEAQYIAEQIEDLKADENLPLNEIAILIRTGYQTREFEDCFIKRGIPYKVIGAKFYERQEIRDAIAYLRLIAQPADDLAFERIINKPRRGLGDTSLAAIRQASRATGLPMLATAEKMLVKPTLKPAMRKNLTQIVTLFDDWRSKVGEMHHPEFAMQVLDQSGYTAMLQAEKTYEAEGRLENLKELITSMAGFESLPAFLEHIALVMDSDTPVEGGEVTLMTLHAAKGLEFDTVFLAGWEEGLFPSGRTLDENGIRGLEEERRIAYVGLTRGRRRVFISYAQRRQLYGAWQNAIPSRFITELPPEHIVLVTEHGMEDVLTPYYQAEAVIIPEQTAGEQKRAFNIDDRVFHEKFGNGTVLEIEGDKLLVDFDKNDRKKVMAGFVHKAERTLE